jgi:hypothetical protein
VAEIHFAERQRGILPWILGLILLALLLAGIAFALRGPAAVGVDDGATPAGNIQKKLQDEENRQPRSLRQWADLHRPAGLLQAA